MTVYTEARRPPRPDQTRRIQDQNAPPVASRLHVGVSGELIHRSGASTRVPSRSQRRRATPVDRGPRREAASTRSSGVSAIPRHVRHRSCLPHARAVGVRSGRVHAATRTPVREGPHTKSSSSLAAPIPAPQSLLQTIRRPNRGSQFGAPIQLSLQCAAAVRRWPATESFSRRGGGDLRRIYDCGFGSTLLDEVANGGCHDGGNGSGCLIRSQVLATSGLSTAETGSWSARFHRGISANHCANHRRRIRADLGGVGRQERSMNVSIVA